MNALLTLQTRLEALGYEVCVHVLAPGTSFAAHCACDSRIDAVFSGQLKLVIGGRVHLLGPGDWIDIPAGVPMTAEVVGDEPVLGIDAALKPVAA
jgi:quercetin dioxygenase-like cupin family protein